MDINVIYALCGAFAVGLACGVLINYKDSRRLDKLQARHVERTAVVTYASGAFTEHAWEVVVRDTDDVREALDSL